MTNEEYHKDNTRISKSGLDLINKSPQHYWHKCLNPNRPASVQTAAFKKGSIFHKLVLEPDTFNKEYKVLPDTAPPYPTTVQWNAVNPSAETRKAIEFWRQLQVAYPSVELITQEEYDLARYMRDAVYVNNAARELFAIGGTSERSVFFTDPVTGAPCKCRPDFETKADIIVDLKSTRDASRDGFGKSAVNYRYHVQAPFYLDGLNAEAGHTKFNHFVFVAVETEPPYGVGVYFTPKPAMELGRDEYIANLRTYVECKSTNTWPSYTEVVEALQIPAWAYKR